MDWLNFNELIDFSSGDATAVTIDQSGEMTLSDNWYESVSVESGTDCASGNIFTYIF